MLSAVVVVRNEEEMIKVCLESLKWADELVLIDNGSTDKTLEIAKKYTDKIFKYDGQDYSQMRNMGMEKSKGDWVVYVDADERVLTPLKEELLNIVEDSKHSAYAISRKNIIYGQAVSYGSYQKDWMIRLFKRSDFKSWEGSIHEHGTFNGSLGYTKNSLLHLTHRDLDQVVNKSLRWSHYDAKLRLDANHPAMSGWRLIRILITETFYQGVVRRGFFSGTVGTIDTLLQTFSLVFTYIRLWEMQQPTPLKKRYEQIDKKLVEDNFQY